MKWIRFTPIFTFAAVLLASTIYTVTDLGASAQAFALNASGLAVGSFTTMLGYTHAFSNSGGVFSDLTIGSAASDGMGAGVNDSGTIAGTQIIGGQAQATEWSGGSAQSIVHGASYAMAINDAGQAVGMLTSGGQGHAFVTINGVPFDLGTLAGGGWSSAYGINSSGEVAGYGDTGSGTFRGVIWSGGGSTTLGTLGGSNSYAMAINDQGQAAGSAQTPSGYMNAALWTNGIVQDLGTLGGTNSYAYGVNDSSQVVGYSYVDGSDSPHAFVFENGVMFDLNSLINASSGWTLNEAYAINGAGEIAGAGMLDGVEHAFLLDPAPALQFASLRASPTVPEPATSTMFAIGLIAVISSRIRLRLRQRRQVPEPGRSQSNVSPQ